MLSWIPLKKVDKVVDKVVVLEVDKVVDKMVVAVEVDKAAVVADTVVVVLVDNHFSLNHTCHNLLMLSWIPLTMMDKVMVSSLHFYRSHTLHNLLKFLWNPNYPHLTVIVKRLFGLHMCC